MRSQPETLRGPSRAGRARLAAGLTILLLLALGAGRIGAQIETVSLRQAISQSDLRADLTGGWVFRSGDDRRWADPDIATAEWTPIETTERLSALADGISWLRLELDTGPEWASRPIAVYLELMGSAQLYLNGELMANFGALDSPTSREIDFGSRFRRLTLPATERVTVAIRYRPDELSFFWPEPSPGFRLTIGEIEAVSTYASRSARFKAAHEMAFVGAFLGQAFLHFVLFLYAPVIRSNFWFALTALCSAGLVGLQFERALSEDPTFLALSDKLWGPLLFLTMVLLLRFTHEVFDWPLSWSFWTLLLVAVVGVVVDLMQPSINAFLHFWWFHLLVLLRMIWISVDKMRNGWRGAWIIGCGLGLLSFGLLWQMLLIVGAVSPPFQLFPVAYYGVVGLLASVSVYLASKFAQLGRELMNRLEQVEELSKKTLAQELEAKERETERRLLEADHRRKTEELEQARELQLSLLPAELPRIDGVELAAAMETATEVGGDFYDFHGDGDSLTVAIGDAAGHGARAGSVVSLTKGMFATFDASADIPSFFSAASSQIRSMSQNGLHMSMALLRVDGHRLSYAAAGMPPAFHYRAATGTVDEILVAGMPLGGLAGFEYRQRSLETGPGDVVLLLTDGLPELLDRTGESLGYERTQRLLAEAAGLTAAEIIDHLLHAAREWGEDDEFPDDVTFVVLKWTGEV